MLAVGELLRIVRVPEAQAIVAYRVFRRAPRGRLQSWGASHPVLFSAGQSRKARCAVGWCSRRQRRRGRAHKQVPAPKGLCGFWAFKYEAHAVAFRLRHQRAMSIRHLIREVTLWGRVAVHEKGYRAQYMAVAEGWSRARTGDD